MKRGTIGIAAHVDAGKTTLSEELLYRTGTIRTKGSVDDGTSLLDSDAMEEERGITIFSAAAGMRTDAMDLVLIDTPGHTDFSGETERALLVLDAAILVISGPEGVQSHTRTLFDLLGKHRIPTFIFVNKMDITEASPAEILSGIRQELTEHAVSFMEDALVREGSLYTGSAAEEIALASEELLDSYLAAGGLSGEAIENLIRERRFFPVLFGSARSGDGVGRLLTVLEDFFPERAAGDAFGAICYKVLRDKKNEKTALLKITGGTLLPRMEIAGQDDPAPEKVTEIRTVRGSTFEKADHADAGTVVAVSGLKDAYPGKGYGIEEDAPSAEVEPVFLYRAKPLGGVSSHTLLTALQELNAEDPLLHVRWDEKTDEIRISLMGEIQKETIRRELADRFAIDCVFDDAEVVYHETIAEETEGHGHFEPLRHFADVWLKAEPLPPGSGISAVSTCPEDELDRNWQGQILRRLLSGRETGVLINAELTDVRFTLLHGQSHKKHTVGGDFRKATDIAVRDALLHGTGRILEPYYHVTLAVPQERMGRALTDIERMHGTAEAPETDGTRAVITGQVPVTELRDYAAEVASYTGGLGTLSIEPGGYGPCHNEEEVIDRYGYDFRTDSAHPFESIYVHRETAPLDPSLDGRHTVRNVPAAGEAYTGDIAADDPFSTDAEEGYTGYGGLEPELQRIFERTYGKIERRDIGSAYTIDADTKDADASARAKEEYLTAHPAERERREKRNPGASARKRYVLVDCYNLIFSSRELHALSKPELESARQRLLELLSNYQGFTGCILTAVFDAYRVRENEGHTGVYDGISVVYTKEGQTADAYIEKAAHEILAKGAADVYVVTSDGAEQMTVAGEGALRIPSAEFEKELERVTREGLQQFRQRKQN